MAKENVLVAHFDGDSFFVSCELLRNPGLRGKPVVTGGERGVVTSMSLEAKQLGIPRGMPCFLLKKNYPQVTILSSTLDFYRVIAKRMYSIVGGYSTSVEEYSIDECFALVPDVESAYKAKTALEAGTGVTFGVGVARTKTLAKVASRLGKPAKFKIVGIDSVPEEFQQFCIGREEALASLPVAKIWGVGPSISEALRKRNINTALELANTSDSSLRGAFSISVANTAAELRGQFMFPLVYDIPARFFGSFSEATSNQKSIMSSQTFHPKSNDPSFLFSEAVSHLDEVCARARAANLAAKRVTVSLKTDGFYRLYGEAYVAQPSASPITLMRALRAAFIQAFEPRAKYRTVGVCLRELTERGVEQELLFGVPEGEATNSKAEHVADVIDSIRHRYGEDALIWGTNVPKRRMIEKVKNKKLIRIWAYPHLGYAR
jgi:nucleotidyltransferase/DNA polymerase involved in DNA repair